MEAHEKSFAFMNGAIRIEIPFFQRGHMTICFTRKMSLHFMMKGISGMKPKFILIRCIRRATRSITVRC